MKHGVLAINGVLFDQNGADGSDTLAKNVEFDNSQSKWSATNVQDAIDEMTAVLNAKSTKVRQKDLTEAYLDGTLISALDKGDFSDILPGDYIIGSSTGMKYWIAHRDPWYNTITGYGLAGNKQHHVLLWPALALGTGTMNDTNTTAGGYVGSKGKQTVDSLVEQYFVADFGDHIKTMNILLTNSVKTDAVGRYGTASGASNNWTWTNVKGVLPSEVNIYGSIVWSSSGFDTGNQDFQLEIIQDMGRDAVIGGHHVWLKDVTSSTAFAIAYGDGLANYNYASGVYEFRPLAVFAA